MCPEYPSPSFRLSPWGDMIPYLYCPFPNISLAPVFYLMWLSLEELLRKSTFGFWLRLKLLHKNSPSWPSGWPPGVSPLAFTQALTSYVFTISITAFTCTLKQYPERKVKNSLKTTLIPLLFSFIWESLLTFTSNNWVEPWLAITILMIVLVSSLLVQ